MKRSTKQLLSMLLAIMMVIGLMAPAMAAMSVMGEVAETPVAEAETPAAGRSSGTTKATLSELTGQATTYYLNFEDTELSSVDVGGSYAAGKYGTGDFFTFSDGNIAKKNVGTGDAAVSGLNIAKNGGNYIGFAITGDDATVKVTFRGASTSGKKSGGAVFAYTGDTKGDALVDPANDTSALASSAVTVTATYTNVAKGDYRVMETANETSVHVLSIEVTETNGNVYTDCTHANATADATTAVAATCTTPGKAADTVCPDCGKVTAAGAAIEALGHNYVNGECSRCGAKEVTVLTGGSWKASLASVPGVSGTATDNVWGPQLAADTQVNTGDITAVELWAPGNNNKYKYKAETGAEGFEGWLSGNDNPVMTATDDGATITSGSYFHFKAKADGILTIYTKVNGAADNAKPYYCVDKDGKNLTPNSGKGFETAQTPLKDTVQVKAGDEVKVWFKGGKIMLYGFDFTVSINESWKANLDSVPGVSGTATDNVWGPQLAADTQVKTDGVTAVELWAPGNNNKYKYKAETGAEGFEGWLSGNDNPVMTATDDGATITSGSYFHFKVKMDGVLTIYTKVNGAADNAKPYYCVDKDGKNLTPNSGKGFETAQTPLKDTVQVKAGDEVKVWFKGGKIMLYGFEFKSGSLDEVTADWTAEAQGATGATITGTPDNTKGTITVTVTGPKVGVITDEAAGTMTTYADSLTVVMKDSAGNVVETKTDVGAGDTHTITFTPNSSGTHTFTASIQRANQTDIACGEGTVTGFILPLAKPAISSASSNGAGADGKVSMNVMWGAVAEAESYKLFVKKTADAAFPTEGTTVAAVDGKTTYSQAVTGLEAGVSYDFKVTATRGDTTTESDPATAVAEATKVINWTEVTFGTSATDLSNSVIGGPVDKARPLTNYQDPGKTATVVTDGNGSYKTEYKGAQGDVKYEFTGLTGDLNTDSETGPVTKAVDKASTTSWGDARVLLSSRDGAGKIKESEGADGLLYYYTAIPAGTNYTLKADVEVLRWATSNTQNGVGLVAMDRVPSASWTGSASGNSGNYWDNIYLVGATRTGFSYDRKGGGIIYSSKDAGYDAYTKYSYYMGLMSVAKYGIPVNPDGTAYSAPSNPTYYYERRFPLDTRIPQNGVTVSEPSNNRFNLIGNYSVKPNGYSMMHTNGEFMKDYELTKFTLVIQKNNTGYISTAYVKNPDGSLKELGKNVDYFVKGAMDLSGTAYHSDDTSGRKDIDSLQCLDKDFEYVGLFTAREMDALFTNVELTTIAAEDDAPAVAPPTTYITPTMSISSGDYSNSPAFNLSVSTNVEGTVTVSQNGATLPETYEVKYNAQGLTDRLDIPVTLKEGNNSFKVIFQPDPDQTLEAFTELKNTDSITKECQVKYETYFSTLNNIYVSPTGKSINYGTKGSPVDVHTAVSVAKPGQNIILLAGEYKLDKGIKIGRGLDGTKDEPIYFFADPDRAEGEKVVLNGQMKVGTVLTAGSNYWVFKDFEVVGSTGTSFLVAGSYNIVQNVKTHDNRSSGLEIARLSSSDHVPVRPTEDKIDGDLEITDWGDWPCYNQIINCESYRNYDAGYDGADGFCAKQTCGIGNVFDGCAAFWNADDGWDFYAKTAPDMGPIGRTTIRNCVSFQNGYEVRKLADVTNVIPEYEEDGYNAVMNLDANGDVILIEAGNGNGFKMGGSHLPGAHRIENSYSFYNKAKGFDSNNGPDIKIVGCTAYNNAQENVGLGSSWTPKNYLVEKTISFKDEKAPVYVDQKEGEILQMKDATPITAGVDTTVYDQNTFFTWTADKKSVNMAGNAEITKADFVSLDFDAAAWSKGAIRDADGTLALGDFLKLASTDKNAGAKELVNGKTEFSDTNPAHPDVDSLPVETPEIVADPEPSTSGGSSGGSGTSGGTISDATKPVDKPDDNKPTEQVFTADKKTDAEGNTEIVVKAEDGEVVADVKIPATIPAPETTFEDVPEGHWAEDSINNMAALGIVKGVGGNTYDMDSAVTRGTIATMLFRFANGKEGKTNPFTDVAGGQWYTDAIAWAASSGVVTGYSETTFGPDDTITREQLAVMLYRFAKLIGMDGTVADSALAGYNDAASVDTWAADGMAWCVANGIINGVSTDTLSPDTSATRAQTATMLDRFIALMK